MAEAKKVKIDKDTAKYYLALETAFTKLCLEVGIDPDAYLENFQSITRSFDVKKRYGFRLDLHDSWEAVVAKKEYRPNRRRNARPSQSKAPY